MKSANKVKKFFKKSVWFHGPTAGWCKIRFKICKNRQTEQWKKTLKRKQYPHTLRYIHYPNKKKTQQKINVEKIEKSNSLVYPTILLFCVPTKWKQKRLSTLYIIRTEFMRQKKPRVPGKINGILNWVSIHLRCFKRYRKRIIGTYFACIHCFSGWWCAYIVFGGQSVFFLFFYSLSLCFFGNFGL